MGMELSKRLHKVCSLVSPGNTVADVGCDHGYVSIYLIQNHISSKCIATDVRKGPLSKAQTHIAQYHLENQIQTRLSDGLEALKPKEAESLILAGMGGRLMIKILLDYPETALGFKEWILQPQSEVPFFRGVLRTIRAKIMEEDMIFEDGKYYPMMKVLPPKKLEADTIKNLQPTITYEDTFGEKLLEQKHPILRKFVQKEYDTYQGIVKQLIEQSMENLQGEPQKNQGRNKERLLELENYLKQLQRALLEL